MRGDGYPYCGTCRKILEDCGCDSLQLTYFPEGRPDRRLGMTASRKGMTVGQSLMFRLLMSRGNELHDGDCLGGDSDGFHIAFGEGLLTVAKPCNLRRYQARNRHHITFPEKDPIPRNHDIVDGVHEMIACPGEVLEQWRGSGTWATIRYCRSPLIRKPLWIIWPNGDVSMERIPPAAQIWAINEVEHKTSGVTLKAV